MLFKKYLKGFLVLLLPCLLFFSAYAARITLNPQVTTVIKVEKERSQFKELLKSNPNYFGTIPQSDS